MLDSRKTEVIAVMAIVPLINFVLQMLSKSILNDPVNVPLLGYKFLPGLVNMIALLKEAFKVPEGAKSQATGENPASKLEPNLLDCL